MKILSKPLSSKQRRRIEEKLAYKTRRLYAHIFLRPTGKRCIKCPASLICTAQRVPQRITRCKRCNTRYAFFSSMEVVSEGKGIKGIARCPDRKAMTYVCTECLRKETEESC